jgi:hypothetical protein
VERGRHWLDRKRLAIYPGIFLALFLATSAFTVLKSDNLVDSRGYPLGYDFINFWAASYIGLAGHAQDAYSVPSLLKAIQVAVPGSQGVFAWFYPPTFYLVILPLAWLPCVIAYWAFMLSTLGFYLLVFRRIVRSREAMWCLAGFPGLWVTFTVGQNGFLTAALAGAALLCLERRPVLAGVFIGLLAMKPHLALLFPVALIAIGAWRAFIAAAVTALAFTTISVIALGEDTLKAFLGNLGYARMFLESGTIPWMLLESGGIPKKLVESGVYPWLKMPSVFSFLRLLGMPDPAAYAIHAVAAVCSVVAVWHVWRCCRDWQLRGAALMTATFLVSPYVFDYDLAWLAFPIAWLTLTGLRDGWLRGEREVLVAAWLLPLLMTLIAGTISIQVGPFVLGALLWITVRRAKSDLACGGAAIDPFPESRVIRN